MKKHYDRRRAWDKKNRWSKLVRNARRRCSYVHHPMYEWYGGAGVRCTLTAEEAKAIWQRDKGWELRRPSIDRFPDPDGHYEAGNVRFIEMGENQRLANERRKAKDPAAWDRMQADIAAQEARAEFR